MNDNRIKKHPILSVPDSKPVHFTWKGQKMIGYAHDMVSSALIANDIHIFGHHHKDQSPQGIFCANGQCAQCTVLINGRPRKSCMTQLEEGMVIDPLDSLPQITVSDNDHSLSISPTQLTPDVLIIGGGPAGLSAASQLGKLGINALLVDDKAKLGGKLILQTHRFFGSVEEVHAGHRGIEIAKILEDEVKQHKSVTLMTETKAVAVFEDKSIGIVHRDQEYLLVTPKAALFTTGARENILMFPGNTLPGVIGAGAFQTLVNRDLVRPGKSVFIVGGGNVGLIAGYHAIQAGIEVKGLIEALPECGGYQVHRDKLARLGVPILTSHTIIAVNGQDHVESITIAQCENFQPIPGTQKTIACDTVLVAVGLHPVNELFNKAQEYGLPSFTAGDAAEISEASAAMITGKAQALRIAEYFGYAHSGSIDELIRAANLLKKRPITRKNPQDRNPMSLVYPIFHCEQEIPCNPCSASCPIHNIIIPSDNILMQPTYLETSRQCINCGQCISICPGLAITIVDQRQSPDYAIVSLPAEFLPENLPAEFSLTDESGNILYTAAPLNIEYHPQNKTTIIAKFSVPTEIAKEIVGFKIQESAIEEEPVLDIIENETIICRCERVTAGQIRSLISQGITDINQIKAITRAGMGACGSKTCHLLIQRLIKEAGIPGEKIVKNTSRPLEFEVELGIFANETNREDE
jgi:NADPH-dependent 2,4-dienoyl-CoA reductase/sulfur reductase-like enzyme/Fe-S-cluster-containing hydrogenase component 2/bacterioferritin-associated ferredoxin